MGLLCALRDLAYCGKGGKRSRVRVQAVGHALVTAAHIDNLGSSTPDVSPRDRRKCSPPRSLVHLRDYDLY